MSNVQELGGTLVLDSPHESVEATPQPAQSAGALVDALRMQCKALDLEHCVLLTGPAVLEAFASSELDPLRRIGATVAELPLQPDRVSRDYWPSLIELDLGHPVAHAVCESAIAMALEDWSPEGLKAAQGHRIGAFLFSSVPFERLARHLATAFVQQRPDGAAQRLLTLADPAAFEGIWRICNPAQRDRLLGPIAVWRTLGRHGVWCEARRPEQNGRADGTASDGQLAFDGDQWRALADVRAINRAWAQMRGAGKRVDQRAFAGLPASLRRAQGYGLNDAQDIERYALDALETGAEFDQHPRIQRLLRERPAQQYYSRTIADLGPSDWAEIRADLAACQRV